MLLANYINLHKCEPAFITCLFARYIHFFSVELEKGGGDLVILIMAVVVSLLLAIFAMAFFTVQAQEFAPAPAPTSDGWFSFHLFIYVKFLPFFYFVSVYII